MGAVTQPRVIQSEQPLTYSPKVIGLGRQAGTKLLVMADYWQINAQLT